jgi:hypothetical protein
VSSTKTYGVACEVVRDHRNLPRRNSDEACETCGAFAWTSCRFVYLPAAPSPAELTFEAQLEQARRQHEVERARYRALRERLMGHALGGILAANHPNLHDVASKTALAVRHVDDALRVLGYEPTLFADVSGPHRKRVALDIPPDPYAEEWADVENAIHDAGLPEESDPAEVIRTLARRVAELEASAALRESEPNEAES